MPKVLAAVSRNLIRAHDLAARKLEERIQVLEHDMEGMRLEAAKANGSPFAAPGRIAAEYLLEDLRHNLIQLRKALTVHRERQLAIAHMSCLVCNEAQSKHCEFCGGCAKKGGLSCEALHCETARAKVPVSV